MLYLDVSFCFSGLLFVGSLGFQEANAQLKCVYFPIVEVQSAISCFGFRIVCVIYIFYRGKRTLSEFLRSLFKMVTKLKKISTPFLVYQYVGLVVSFQIPDG